MLKLSNCVKEIPILQPFFRSPLWNILNFARCQDDSAYKSLKRCVYMLNRCKRELKMQLVMIEDKAPWSLQFMLCKDGIAEICGVMLYVKSLHGANGQWILKI